MKFWIFSLLLPVALLAAPAKRSVTAGKVTGSIIDYMAEYNRLADEKEKRERYEGQSWLVVNQSPQAVQLQLSGGSISAAAGESQRTELPSHKGESLRVLLGDKRVSFDSLEPGLTRSVEEAGLKLTLDYLSGAGSWFLLIEAL